MNGSLKTASAHLALHLAELLAELSTETSPERLRLWAGTTLLLQQALTILAEHDGDPLWQTFYAIVDERYACDEQRFRCEIEALLFLLRNL